MTQLYMNLSEGSKDAPPLIPGLETPPKPDI